MALNFNPPEWLIQEYMNRKTPYEEASQGIQTAVNTYLTIDQNNRKNRELADESKRRDQEMAMKGEENFYKHGSLRGLAPEIQQGMMNPAQGPSNFVPSGPVMNNKLGPVQSGQTANYDPESGSIIPNQQTGTMIPPQKSLIIQHYENVYKKYPYGTEGAKLENVSDFIPQLDASGAVIGMTRVERPRFGKTLPPTKPQSEGDGRKLDLSQERNDLRRNNQARDYAKMFDADMDVKKATTEFTQSTRALKMLAEGNPVADQAIRVVAARASGEVGNLAQAEQEVYGGSPALTTWLKRNAVRITEGKLDEQDREYLNQLFTVYKNYGQQRLKQRHEYHAQRFSQNTGTPIEDARKGIGDLSIIGVGGSGGGGVSQTGPHGNTVTQNGVTYTWNPGTGQYE